MAAVRMQLLRSAALVQGSSAYGADSRRSDTQKSRNYTAAVPGRRRTKNETTPNVDNWFRPIAAPQRLELHVRRNIT